MFINMHNIIMQTYPTTSNHFYIYALIKCLSLIPYYSLERVYGQFSIETIHERRKRNREFSGLFFSVLLIRIGKQNVKIIVK